MFIRHSILDYIYAYELILLIKIISVENQLRDATPNVLICFMNISSGSSNETVWDGSIPASYLFQFIPWRSSTTNSVFHNQSNISNQVIEFVATLGNINHIYRITIYWFSVTVAGIENKQHAHFH